MSAVWTNSARYLKRQITNHRVILIIAAVAIVGTFILPETAYAFDDQRYKTVCQKVINLFEGPFGAMLTAAAGVGAVVCSAMGGFKMAWACLVVSVSAFIMRSYVTLFFDTCV